MVCQIYKTHAAYAFILFILFSPGCKRKAEILVDINRPQRILINYYDQKYLLYKLADDCYKGDELNHSFGRLTDGVVSEFKPLGFDSKLNLQYSHVYSEKCAYHTDSSIWKYAEVCFPNTCLTKDKAYAKARLKNTSQESKTYYVRLFYQNTTYWYPTNDSVDLKGNDYLDNYYGASEVAKVTLDPQQDTVVSIPYSIGMDPKNEFSFDPSKAPARPGNYEFMLLAKPDKGDVLLADKIDLQKINPFAEVKKDELQNSGKKYFEFLSYTGPHHFKFVFLDEYFDGKNDLDPNHIYIVKNGQEKRLCDTCTNTYKAVINESWRVNDFFKGFIYKAPFVKAEYGIKKENCVIDQRGITITIPASKAGSYKKTWGEFIFGPAIKYGHLTVRAKFAQMMNGTGTPNGIIHNLSLLSD